MDDAPRAPAILAGIPEALARACRAEWVLFRGRSLGWIEVRAGRSAHTVADRTSRCLDLGFLIAAPRGKLLRVPAGTLQRRPRHAGTRAAELLLYVEPGDASVRAFVAVALSKPLDVRPELVEDLARALVAVDAMQRALEGRGDDRWNAHVDRAPSCATHDLRHALTVAGLEIERSAADVQAGERADWSRATSALAEARSLCDRALSGAVLGHESIDVARLLREEIAAAPELSGRRRGVPVDLRCADPLPLSTQPTTLRRIVRNVLLNAIAASPDGSRVVVEAHRFPHGELRISVSDSGCGMAASDVRDLLEFGRSGRGGHGMGTASAAACARQLGGELVVRSQLFAGTSVVLRLPMASRAVRETCSIGL